VPRLPGPDLQVHRLQPHEVLPVPGGLVLRLCGSGIEASTPYLDHYDRRNALSPCAGRQFTAEGTEEPPAGPGPCARALRLLLFYSPLALPFYLLALAAYLLTTLLLLPRLCSDPDTRRSWLRPVTVVTRIVTALWAVTGVTVCVVVAAALLAASWVVGLAAGCLCLPLALLFGSRTTVPQAAALCCCCWAPFLLFSLFRDADPDADPEAEGEGEGEAPP
jgi:hypothetical protein